jgi:benzoylformate decarboxylase
MSINTGRFKIMRQFRVDGMTEIFGNPGTSEQNLIDLLRMEEFSDFRYYLGLHEGAVVAMADSYARYRQKPVAVQLHSYAGLANGLGMLYYAKRGYTPMVVVVGEAGLRYEALDAQMSADLVGLARPFVKCDHNGPCVWRAVDEHSILRLLRRAIKCAGTPPFGPTVLVLPMDVLERECPENPVPTLFPDFGAMPSAKTLSRAADLLLDGRNPIIIMGDGVAAAGATEELSELASLLGATVYGANNSEVNISASDPLYGGDTGHMFGNYSQAVLASADVVLICGTTVLPEVFPLVDGVFSKHAKIIQFDLNTAEIAKNFPADIAGIGDPKLVFRGLAETIKQRQNPESYKLAQQRISEGAARRRAEEETVRASDSSLPLGQYLRASQFVKILAERLECERLETLIFDEALTHSPEVTRYLKPTRPRSYFQTRAGMLGTGLPGTVGLKAAARNKLVIGFVGDGGGISTIQALGTAARHGLGAKFVVCNNRSYRILKYNIRDYWAHWLGQSPSQSFPEEFDLEKSALRFDLLAQGLNVKATRVENASQIAPAIDAMLADDDPYLIDLVLDKTL